MGVLDGHEELGGGAVGVLRVGGDHGPGKVQGVEQGLEPGDLVGLGVHVALGEDRAGGVVHAGKQVDTIPGAAGAADGLALDRDRPSAPVRMVTVGQPGAERPRKRVSVQAS